MPAKEASATVFGPLPSFEGVPLAPLNKTDLLETIDDALQLLAVKSEDLRLLLRHADTRVECKCACACAALPARERLSRLHRLRRLDKLHYLYRVELDLDSIPPGPAARMLIARHTSKHVSDACVSEDPVALLEPRDPRDEDGLGCTVGLRHVSHVFGARVETMRIFACRRLADGSALSVLVAGDLDENNAW
eukprot:tig00000057_g19.t1